MGFLGTIFLFFIFYVLWGVIKLAWRIHRVRRQSADMFAQMFGAAAGNRAADPDSRGRKAGWSQGKRPRRKHFDKSDGEYVRFDDIKVTGTHAETTDSHGNRVSADTADIRVTSRIEDAEWEDLP